MYIKIENAKKRICPLMSSPTKVAMCVVGIGIKTCPVWRFVDTLKYFEYKKLPPKSVGYCGLGGKPAYIRLEED